MTENKKMTAKEILESKDAFAILGVEDGTPADDPSLKKSYKKLAMRFHEDRINQNADLSEEDKEEYRQAFLKVKDAYSFLSDTSPQKDIEGKDIKSKREFYDLGGWDAAATGELSNGRAQSRRGGVTEEELAEKFGAGSHEDTEFVSRRTRGGRGRGRGRSASYKTAETETPKQEAPAPQEEKQPESASSKVFVICDNLRDQFLELAQKSGNEDLVARVQSLKPQGITP